MERSAVVNSTSPITTTRTVTTPASTSAAGTASTASAHTVAAAPVRTLHLDSIHNFRDLAEACSHIQPGALLLIALCDDLCAMMRGFNPDHWTGMCASERSLHDLTPCSQQTEQSWLAEGYCSMNMNKQQLITLTHRALFTGPPPWGHYVTPTDVQQHAVRMAPGRACAALCQAIRGE